MAVEGQGQATTRGRGNGRGKGKGKRPGGDRAFGASAAAMGGVVVGDRVHRERRHAPNAFVERDVTDDEDDRQNGEEAVDNQAEPKTAKRSRAGKKRPKKTKSMQADSKARAPTGGSHDQMNGEDKEILSGEGAECNDVLEPTKRQTRSVTGRKQGNMQAEKGGSGAEPSKGKSLVVDTKKVTSKGSKDDKGAMKRKQRDAGMDVLTKKLRTDENALPSKDEMYDEKKQGKKMLTGENARMCHQCQRNDKERVVRCKSCNNKRFLYPACNDGILICQKMKFAAKCPYCRKNCNCKLCLRMRGVKEGLKRMK